MNGKKARGLRQKARALTVGQPKAAYTTDANGSAVLLPSSTKGMYRKLKKEYLERKRTSRGQR